MDVSIILVNYKTKDLTINCIESIYEKTKDLNFEIFVVDNNSDDGSIEAIEEKFSDIKIIKNQENYGFGKANNIAIKVAKGKYIFCLNTDTLLINNAIKNLFDFMEDNNTIGACGGNLYDAQNNPVMCYSDFPNLWNCTSLSWLIRKVIPSARNKTVKKVKEVDFVAGADIFFRKDVLDKIGLFDEKFFMYCEEVDLCKRIKDNGYSIKIVPEAQIIHLAGKSSTNFWRNTKMRVKSKYIYARKHQSLLDIYSMKISYLIMHTIGYLLGFNKEHIELIKLHLEG